MAVITYFIGKNLAKLNEHDSANRANKFGGANLKKKMTELVAGELEGKRVITSPVKLGFVWGYSSKHDFDNIAFARKYVLDGMVKAHILPNDNQKWVKGFLGDEFIKVEEGGEYVTVLVEWYDRS